MSFKENHKVRMKKAIRKLKDELESGVAELKGKFLNSINTLEQEAKKGNEFFETSGE